MTIKFSYIRRIVLASLLALILAIRFVPYGGEFYATYLYPGLSFALSLAGSFIPYSLEEIIVCAFLGLLCLYPLIAFLCKRRHILWGELEIILWLVAWFYLGWGCNYFRTDFYERLMITPVEYAPDELSSFLKDYAQEANAAYTPVSNINKEEVRAEIKELFLKVPKGYGLAQPRSFQEPKQLLFNELYSEVGVLGFMGPFMAESQLNEELSPLEYPFTYAHELSHLLGISNEAEANFWAFCICSSSPNSVIRYSAYNGILAYAAQNAQMALPEEAYHAWLKSLKPQILEDESKLTAHWQARKNPTLKEAQKLLYNFFLKSNNIQNGMQNYSEVIGMLISKKKSQEEPLRRQGRALSTKQ